MNYVVQAYTKTGDSSKIKANYKHIDSEYIYDIIKELGYSQVQNSVSKKATIYSRHVTQFQNNNDIICGELRPRLIVDNSHNGTRACYIRFGMFRIYCANGLVMGSDIVKPLRIVHKGHKQITKTELIEFVANARQTMISLYSKMRTIELSEDAINLFSALAHEIRYNKTEGEEHTINMVKLSKRIHDEGNNLWVVYNRLQERLIHGTIYKSKKLKSGRTLIDFNNKLSNLAMKFVA